MAVEKVLNPGSLRNQITWQQKVVTGQNATGEDIYTWTDFLTCKAEVVALSGDELRLAQQYFALAKYQVTQHYSVGVNAAMRILWYIDGQVLTLDPLNINAQGQRRYQVVLAKDSEQ